MEKKLGKRGYSAIEAAEYLGVSHNTLRQGRSDGPLPGRMPAVPYVKFGRRIIYMKEDLDAILNRYRVLSGC